MPTDPQVRELAVGRLTDLFQGIGRQAQGDTSSVGDIGGLIGQVQEFASMPMDLAVLFLDMSVELAETVLTALEQAGFILVKGVTPL